MEIIPAIDLRGGQVVRLAQGDYGRQTVYSSDPAEIARTFAAAEARWIHVVDLDAARSGRRANAESIRRISRTPDVQVELGGGIRSDADVDEALAMGVARVVIGSAALNDWEWFARLCGRTGSEGRIVLGLDARGGRLARQGWTEDAGATVDDLARRARELPIAAIVYTDIERDGMLSGPDLETTARLIELTGRSVVASGGISSPGDLDACRRIGCAGAIVGRAWYEGRIDLAEAVRRAASPEPTE